MHTFVIVLRIAQQHGATNVRIFGSFPRNEQRRTSDVNLFVTLPKQSSLFDLAGLKIDLEEALTARWDMLTEEGISPYLREQILREATLL